MTEPYLYQTLHLRAGRARRLAQHVNLLRRLAPTVLGISWDTLTAHLEARIAALAAAERYPRGLSAFARLELTAQGEQRLLPGGVSLYAGYALRSLMPDAVTVAYDIPLYDAPTSAREAAMLLARRQAERRGASVAVRCDDTGMLVSADDAPLFAVRNGALYTSPAAPSVERELVFRACDAAGIRIYEHPVREEELRCFDELFFADHRGVTALAHCDGQPFMAVVAERVAAAMEAAADG